MFQINFVALHTVGNAVGMAAIFCLVELQTAVQVKSLIHAAQILLLVNLKNQILTMIVPVVEYWMAVALFAVLPTAVSVADTDVI
mmetsp:Transcript_7564/g.11317  ORF Transcript_7564/g.11317 Transcript_7564/m.11317 type:complete len:85 (+) Transcript_7564:335-589(+)